MGSDLGLEQGRESCRERSGTEHQEAQRGHQGAGGLLRSSELQVQY
jgi:hypothetical protein